MYHNKNSVESSAESIDHHQSTFINNPNHANLLLARLNSARFQNEDEAFTDLVIILNNTTEFKCHCCVLAIHSQYAKLCKTGLNAQAQKNLSAILAFNFALVISSQKNKSWNYRVNFSFREN